VDVLLDNGTCTARHATLPFCSVLLAAVTRCGEDGNQATVQGRRGMPCMWVWVGQFGIGPYVMRSLPAFAGGVGMCGCEACTWRVLASLVLPTITAQRCAGPMQ
jgi:hypothetical protein